MYHTDLYSETLGLVETEVEIDDFNANFNATSSKTVRNSTERGKDNCPQQVTLVMLLHLLQLFQLILTHFRKMKQS